MHKSDDLTYVQYVNKPKDVNEPKTNQSESVFNTQLHHSFVHRGLPFFMLNSRSKRSHRNNGSASSAPLIDALQMQRLKNWLIYEDQQATKKRPTYTPKIIASPSILLPRHRRSVQNTNSQIHSDSWDGFPATLNELLRFIAENELQNVVFLSGDLHLGVSCEAVLTATTAGSETSAERGDKQTRILSLHTTGLYAPYPFANALPEELLGEETFTLPTEGTEVDYEVSCKVQNTHFQRGEGFTQLNCEKTTDNNWQIDWVFDANKNSDTNSKNIVWNSAKGLHNRP